MILAVERDLKPNFDFVTVLLFLVFSNQLLQGSITVEVLMSDLK